MTCDGLSQAHQCTVHCCQHMLPRYALLGALTGHPAISASNASRRMIHEVRHMSQAVQLGASQAMGPPPLCPRPSIIAGGHHNVHRSSQEKTCGCKLCQAIGSSQGPGVRLLCRDAPGSESDQLSASCDSSDKPSASAGGAGAAGAVLDASALHARIRPCCSQLDMTAGAC